MSSHQFYSLFVYRTSLGPMYRNIDWTMSGTDREDSFILIGRNPSVLQIGKDQVTLLPLPVHSICVQNGGNIPSPLTLTAASPRGAAEQLIAEGFPHLALISEYFQCAPIAIHFLSPAGKLLWVNDAELRHTGYSAEEYIGHEIKEVIWTFIHCLSSI